MNNRQGGRRRGRGGPRPQGMSGNAGGGARDSRQRGNAAQLLEKYKALARDAQLSGDRVQTEYYLQFADHYFRVLSETRSRFEDQRPRRDDDEDGEELEDEVLEGEVDDEPRQDRRRDRDERPRRERTERAERSERSEEEGGERRERFSRDRDDRTERRPRRERLNGRERDADGEDEGLPRIAQDILPPAIGIPAEPVEADAADAREEEAPLPRRRTRRVRPIGDDGEIAPAA